ncbi:MAG: hypothetical protein K8R21_06835 [Leptospira sp.]|nr:hypothetical protein [Leptospira sp.]
MADPNSFNELKETLFGNLLCDVWESSGREINEFLNCFLQSPRSIDPEILKLEFHERQVIYNIIPEKIRKSISIGDHDGVITSFKSLIDRELLITDRPRPDIALELLEWIFTGYEEGNLILRILETFTKSNSQFPEDFIDKLKIGYSALMDNQAS